MSLEIFLNLWKNVKQIFFHWSSEKMKENFKEKVWNVQRYPKLWLPSARKTKGATQKSRKQTCRLQWTTHLGVALWFLACPCCCPGWLVWVCLRLQRRRSWAKALPPWGRTRPLLRAPPPKHGSRPCLARPWRGWSQSGQVTNPILFCWLFTIKDRCKKVRCKTMICPPGKSIIFYKKETE